MVEPLSKSKLNVFQALCDDLKGDRLAIDMLLAVVAGDTIPEAIERLKKVRQDLPEKREGRKNADRIFNDLAIRGREILDLTIHDLEQLAEREREREG